MIAEIKRITTEIRHGENVDIYLGVALAVVIGLLGAFQIVSAQVIAAAILATLGLLAVSVLHNRRTMESVQRCTEHVDAELERWSAESKRPARASEVLQSGYPNLTQEFHDATRVSILGIAVHRIFMDYSSEFEHVLRHGGTMRLIVAEQSPAMYTQLVFRSATSGDAEEFRNRLKSSIARIKSLADRTHAKDNVEVKTIPYVPPYSLVWIEKADNTAFIVVKLYSFRRPDLEQPAFIVYEDLDRKWYLHFRDQFEQLWENCQVQAVQ